MKDHPILFSGPLVRAILSGKKTQTRRLISGRALAMIERDSHEILPCPYGQPGDRLWVREAWGYDQDGPHSGPVLFRADRDDPGIRWRPSIHMPRWASRLSLEVVEVRVQRIQDISEEDAQAEGIHEHPAAKIMLDAKGTHVGAFLMAWNAINGKRPGGSWEANPWVWAVSFRRVQP